MSILHIKFDTQYELCSAFLRFQEFYESTEFQGKVFTHEAFFDWYASRNKDKEMSYFRDWSGFNLPDTAFTKFIEGEFDPLWKKEHKLLYLIEKNNLISPYYIIGTYGDDEAREHEIVHGLYYLYPEYAKMVNAVLSQWKRKDINKLKAALSEMRYAASVQFDEINAFTTTGWHKNLPSKRSISYKELKKTLVEAAIDYFGVPKAKSISSVLDVVSKQLVASVSWDANV